MRAHRDLVVGVGLLASLLVGCGGPDSGASRHTGAPRDTGAPRVLELDPPAAPGAFAPRLATGESELLLTWWEPVGESSERRFRLMFSRFVDSWSPPSVVVEERDFFANWADFPAVIREPSGSLLVTWLEKTAEATFAYSIEVARSPDDGETWQELGRLNDDSTDTEHGFVSLVREDDAVRAFWLDGRGMVAEGPMTVRTARIGATIEPSELLDERVCECCPTDAAESPQGAVVVYRDRGVDETREIHSVRGRAGDWSAPEPVTADGWQIPGCPVNGPAIDWRDDRTAVAWFTGADSEPRVAVRFGLEAAATSAVVVDAERPLGRVGLALDGDGTAVVSWLALTGDEAELRLRRVAPDGRLAEPLALGRTSGSRSSGMPQLGRRGDRLVAAWVEIFEGVESRIRVREIPAALVPAV